MIASPRATAIWTRCARAALFITGHVVGVIGAVVAFIGMAILAAAVLIAAGAAWLIGRGSE